MTVNSNIFPLLRRRFCLAATLLAVQVCSAATIPTPPLPGALIPEDPSWAKNHPRIVLTTDEVARVKKRINDDPEVAALWSQLKGRCDGYVNPGSATFLDTSKAFDDYVAMATKVPPQTVGLDHAAAYWLTPIDHLAFAYAITGDERYGKKVVEMELAAATKMTPQVMSPGFYYTRSYLLRSMALALDWCYPAFTSDQRQTIRQALIDHTNDFYFQNFTNTWGESTLSHVWNWVPGIASAWGLSALVLNGETHAPTRQWTFQAARNVEDYLRFGIDAQGGIIEGPSYLGYGAGYTPFFLEGFMAQGGEDLYTTTNYKQMAEWLPLEILPGKDRVNNLEDSDFAVWGDTLIYALYREPDRARARYLWEQLLQAGNPSSLVGEILWAPEKQPADVIAAFVAKLPDYGWAGGRSLVVSRSGYGPDDAYFSLHAQHYTAIKHDQADKGQFTLYAYGDDLAIDSGYGNDANFAKSSSGYAHNQMMVDGKPELQGGAHAQTDGWVLDSLHAPVVDLTCLDVADAYRYSYTNRPEVSYQMNYQQSFLRADRHALFVRSPFPYAAVFDDVQKDSNAHAYTWLLHAKDGKAFVRNSNGIDVVPRQDSAQVAVICPLTDPPSPSEIANTKWQVTVQIPTAGKYRIWGLTGTANPQGEASNSFSLRINGGKQGFSQGILSDSFNWATVPKLPLTWWPLNDNNGSLAVPALQFEAGPVQIELIVRETGADCAAIALVPDGASPPAQGQPLPAGSVIAQASEGEISGKMTRETIRPTSQRAWLQVGFLAPEKWDMQTDVFQTTREGVHPRASITMNGNDGQFLTLLVPHPLKDNKPEGASAMQSVPAQKGHAGVLTITDGLSDLIAAWDGQGIAVQNIETDAELLWLRRDAGGKIVGAAASNVSHIAMGGRQIFTSNQGKTCFVLDGNTASIPDTADVKFDLPGETIQVQKIKRSADWFSSPPGR